MLANIDVFLIKLREVKLQIIEYEMKKKMYQNFAKLSISDVKKNEKCPVFFF